MRTSTSDTPSTRPTPSPLARRVAVYTAVAQGHDEVAGYLADRLGLDRFRCEQVVSRVFGRSL